MKELTKAEEQVMQILWSLQSAIVRDIMTHFPDPKPACTTVSTIVRILEKKGFVEHGNYGNVHYVTSKNEINSRYKIFKDLTTVCKYNSNCSKHIIIAHLPYEYIRSKLGYYYNWIPYLITINNVIYCTYPYSDKVFNITDGQKEAFKLQNIPFHNDDVIEYFANHNLNISNTDGGLTQKDISNLMPLRVWKIIPMKNTVGVLLSSKNENEDINKSDYYFQEYTLDGKLLHYTRIQTENENGKFYHVSYEKKNNMLLTFRKHKNEGWKMEKAKWE